MNCMIRWISQMIDLCLLVVFLLILFMGGYSLYDSYLLRGRAKDTSLLRYRPEKKEEWGDAEKLSEDMVAWLIIDGTKIDFPVMQGENNMEYLNKDPYGQYSLSGSIFLDSRNAPDFSDHYNLIYGHHMDGDAMFGTLDAYLREGYLAEHAHGKLVLDEAEYEVNLFAVVDASGRDPVFFDPTDGGSPLDYTLEHARYSTKFPTYQEKLIALTTCKNAESVERTIILGTLTEDSVRGDKDAGKAYREE